METDGSGFVPYLSHAQYPDANLHDPRSGSTFLRIPPSFRARGPQHATRSLLSRTSTPPTVSRAYPINSACKGHWPLQRLLLLLTR